MSSSSIAAAFRSFTRAERRVAGLALALLLIALGIRAWLFIRDHSILVPVSGGRYTEGAVGQPTLVNPFATENPIDQDIAALVFSPLRVLSASIEPNDDGTAYTLTLRQDLMWDDGEPLTADDVLFTIRTAQNPQSSAPATGALLGVDADRVSALQVRIAIPAPDAFFPDRLAATPVIPEHIYGAVPVENFSLSSYALRPVGSGPYRFHSFTTRSDGYITEYRLVANDRYAGERPFIETFSFRFYETEEALADALRVREVGGTGGLLPFGEAFDKIPGLTADTFPMTRYYAVFLNPANATVLKSRDLRHALSLAADRSRIATEVFDGWGTPISVPAFRESTAGAGPAPEYNPIEARTIVAKSNPGKEALTLVVPRTPLLERTGELLRDAWAAVGIDVTLLALDPDEVVRTIVPTRNYDMLLFGNTLRDPADLFPFWHSSQASAPGMNLARYQSKQADAALERLRAAHDTADRAAALGEVLERISEDAPAVFLVSLPYRYLHTERLGGIAPELVTSPADRFRNVAQWSVTRARVFK